MSSATKRPYPLTMVCETWRVARSSVYALRARLGRPLSDGRQPGTRGPKTALSDEELVQVGGQKPLQKRDERVWMLARAHGGCGQWGSV